jgi:hypothetical protein
VAIALYDTKKADKTKVYIVVCTSKISRQNYPYSYLTFNDLTYSFVLSFRSIYKGGQIELQTCEKESLSLWLHYISTHSLKNSSYMFSLYVTTIALYYFAYFCVTESDTQKKFVPSFHKNVKIDIHQFDSRIPIKYINCTRQLKKHIFTITFELQRQLTKIDQIYESDMVVTLFSGPCSSSTATLNIGRTFPSIHGSLDGSIPSSIASSHLPWNEQSQLGTISYEYGGAATKFAQLSSVLIHIVIRRGREDMMKGIYVIKFDS